MTTRVLSEIAFGASAYEATLKLRNEVLRKPLGLELTDEELSRDKKNHLVCEEEGEVIGC